jgi:glycine/D-amino acid oxidase-like deaminating enzyme
MIIGAGIAGMVAARTFQDAGLDIVIIDNARKGAASVVAAGLVNPITGKRFELSWRYEEFLHLAKSFYAECERKDGQSSYYASFPMIRLFANEKEQMMFEKKYSTGSISRFVGEQFTSNDHVIDQTICNHHGGFRTLNAGIFSYADFLESTTMLFSKSIVKGFVDAENLSHKDDTWKFHVHDRVVKSKFVIFCDGWQGSINPWLSQIGLNYDIVKGESCIMRAPKLPETDIISRGFAILPLGDHLFRCAATFQWNEMHTIPTVFGEQRLHDRIRSLIRCDYEILEQSAGLRPTMFDHTPFLGEHPHHRGIYAIGGLGTKGALYAPYMANNLLQYIYGKQEIDKEMDISCKFHHKHTH